MTYPFNINDRLNGLLKALLQFGMVNKNSL